jgi:hypothetical protein
LNHHQSLYRKPLLNHTPHGTWCMIWIDLNTVYMMQMSVTWQLHVINHVLSCVRIECDSVVFINSVWFMNHTLRCCNPTVWSRRFEEDFLTNETAAPCLFLSYWYELSSLLLSSSCHDLHCIVSSCSALFNVL